ncbi:unnamed protein product [Didymodactylos carnosus]|uniref:Methyltransferase type 11 domain-containing protein n=1 Tax=Didymodactylos carnosus TaxID=1234261 RepID=A0A813W0Y0_9BILA|nr:unnamed protein product [Didymodactylos carnosus]CAF0849250.1 unnamed protein product [Didymodactylos carnosus]CAF3607293.1 unnamed protein product [Didymodactylos carnosus]CAF3636765.1 unnamed protein product [Didymodactylos carnosus]
MVTRYFLSLLCGCKQYSVLQRFLSSSHASSTVDQLSHEWDVGASEYDQVFTQAFQVYAQQALDLTVTDSTTKNIRLLDVGCGGGALSLLAATKGYDVTAVDYSPRMIELLKSKTNRVHAHVMNGENMREFQDNTFDYVYSLFSLMFYPNPLRGVEEIYRVCKRKCCIVTWSSMSNIEWVKRNNRALLKVKPNLPRSKHTRQVESLSNVNEFRNLLIEANVKAENIQIHKVAKSIDIGNDPYAFWKNMTRSFPAIRETLHQHYTKDEQNQVEQEFVKQLENDFGTNKNIKLTGEALFVIAEK